MYPQPGLLERDPFGASQRKREKRAMWVTDKEGSIMTLKGFEIQVNFAGSLEGLKESNKWVDKSKHEALPKGDVELGKADLSVGVKLALEEVTIEAEETREFCEMIHSIINKELERDFMKEKMRFEERKLKEVKDN